MNCWVCGLEQNNSPWGEDNSSPTFDICSCCGVEFGYEDITLVATRQYRNEWLGKGAVWFKQQAKPNDWSLEKQLTKIPPEFR